MEGMILQIVYVEDNRVQVSDGMNTAFLNINRESETLESLCRCINKSASRNELLSSIFLFSDFSFDFDWDYENLKLNVSLECDSFHFLYPGALHERVFRSKDLSAVLGKTERETLKREAMKKKLNDNPFEGIDMGELFGIVSSGGVIVEEEEEKLNVRSLHRKIEKVGGDVLGRDENQTQPLDKTLMKNGWLIFPQITEPEVPIMGNVYDTVECFLRQRRFYFTIDCTNEDSQACFKITPDKINNLIAANMNIRNLESNKNRGRAENSTKNQKLRLKKEMPGFIMKDSDDSFSPTKHIRVKVDRSRKLTQKEIDELDHLENLTKDNELERDNDEKEVTKKMKRVKTAKTPQIELRMRERSPTKVAVRLRVPQTERSYGLRNRHDLGQ